jgi:hypothetical protein
VRILFELEERLGTRILERLYSEAAAHGRTTDTDPAGEPVPPTRTTRAG